MTVSSTQGELKKRRIWHLQLHQGAHLSVPFSFGFRDNSILEIEVTSCAEASVSLTMAPMQSLVEGSMTEQPVPPLLKSLVLS